MTQTYRTRVLTAQDNRLVDALERDPRFRKVAAILRSPKPSPRKTAKADFVETPKPVPPVEAFKDAPVGFDDDDREPPRPVVKPTPRKSD